MHRWFSYDLAKHTDKALSALGRYTEQAITMIATDDKRSEYPTDLADLRRVPLADVSALTDDMHRIAMRRLVPAPLAGQVPVAAFNSSI